MEVKQELLPGIPGDISLSNIAPKLQWEACNVLQCVSRGWQQIISDRSVYDSKFRLNATEPFLLLLSLHLLDKIVASVYFCKDGSSRKLPPILVPNAAYIDCICLDGRIFVWVTTRTPAMGRVLNGRMKYGRECWTMDLVGDRQWARQNQVMNTSALFDCGYGVLEENIYRFRGGSNFLEPEMCIAYRNEEVPQTEIYDTRHDAWSFITPAPVQFPNPIPYHVSIFRWAKEQQAADPSKTLLIDGNYEPFFSEWLARQTVGSLKSWTTDNNSDLGTQVFYTRAVRVLDASCPVQDEHFFFSGAKLFKLISKRLDMKNGRAKLQVYDTRENKWEQWRLFSMKFHPMDEAGYSWHESQFVSADNAVWATVTKLCADGSRRTSLVRSPECLSEESAELLSWLDTGYSLNQMVVHKVQTCDQTESYNRRAETCDQTESYNRRADTIVLRPIYL